MTHVLVDTSVLIKWFHEEGEPELVEARAIRDAHIAGHLDAHMLDLAIYEVGNVLARALRWRADDVADQLEDLAAIAGPALVMSQAWFREAARLTEVHGLSYYDACWAAAARGLEIPLISADRQLLAAGLAESASDSAFRLRLV